jgi:transposase
VISEMPNVKNFSSAKEYAAFVDVTPNNFESGSSVKRRSRISKIGAKNVRNIVYMSAISVKNHNESFLPFVNRLKNKGKQAKAIIIAVVLKLMHIFFGILKNNATFDEKLAFGA